MRTVILYSLLLTLILQSFGIPLQFSETVKYAHAAARVNHLGISGKTIFGSTPPNPPNLQSGLVGHWTFDGKDIITNVRDKSGQGNHGTLSGFTSTTTSSGKLGQALEFDGTDDYVSILDNASLDQASSYSVGAWVNADSLLNQSWDSIVTKGSSGDGGGNDHNYLLGYNNNGGIGTTDRWLFLLENSSGSNCNLVGNAAATRGQWYFVMGVFDDAADVSQIYVNGVKQNEIACALTVTTNANPVRIGDDEDTVGAPWNGRIDDVRIYNRALSASEVQQLYKIGNSSAINAGNTLPNLQNGLVGHWTFDGKDMITNVRDISGQGNHGTLAANTTTTTVSGRMGQGINFNGTSGRVSVPASSSLNNLAPLTASAWVYPKSYGEGNLGKIVGKDTSVSAHSWQLATAASVAGGSCTGSPTNFYLFQKLGAATNIVVQGCTPSSSVTLNQWQHIVVTWDGTTVNSSGVKMYKNGVDISSATNAYTPDTTGSDASLNVTIGNRPADDRTFDGYIDDVRIYNRALSAAEVLQLYNLGR